MLLNHGMRQREPKIARISANIPLLSCFSEFHRICINGWSDSRKMIRLISFAHVSRGSILKVKKSP